MQQCWIGSAHFTPGTTQSQHAAEVTDHLGGLPATTLPVLLGCDVNSVLSWGLDEHGDAVVAPNNGKTSEFVSLCHTRGFVAHCLTTTGLPDAYEQTQAGGQGW